MKIRDKVKYKAIIILLTLLLLFDRDFEVYNVKCNNRELNFLQANKKYETNISSLYTKGPFFVNANLWLKFFLFEDN